MKKEVKIITYCSCMSIGSVLQAFALSKTLKDSGYENEVCLEEWNRDMHRDPPRTWKELLKWAYKMPQNGKIRSAVQKRLRFISKHINAEYFQSYESFEQRALENQDAVYLAGSDQVWNPDRCNPLFFLDFVHNSKRVSYAASMGKTQIPSEKKDVIETMLRRFDKISVREKECVDALQEFTDKEISVHVDPTFLIDIEEWRSLEKSYKVKEPYILLYMLYWDNSCRNQIMDLKKRTGLPVYAVCPNVSRVYADKYLYDVGIEEFLWLVDHAEYVVTSSFHGAVFSIIFQKKFAAVINPAAPSRIEHLLKVLQVPQISIGELEQTDSIAYETVFANIETERQRSIEYLKEAIG